MIRTKSILFMAQSLFCMVGAQEQQNGRIPAKGFTLNAPEVDCAIIDKVCHHVQQGKVQFRYVIMSTMK